MIYSINKKFVILKIVNDKISYNTFVRLSMIIDSFSHIIDSV